MRTKDTILLEKAYENILENFYNNLEDFRRFFMDFMNILESIIQEIDEKRITSKVANLFKEIYSDLKQQSNSGRFESFDKNENLKFFLRELLNTMRNEDNVKEFDGSKIQKFVDFVKRYMDLFGL